MKIKESKFDFENQLINIIYQKGNFVNYITLTFEEAEEIKFINFNNLNNINL